MKRTVPVVLVALGLAGCGGSGSGSGDATVAADRPAPAMRSVEDAADARAASTRIARRGTKLTLRGSEFGSMLFGPGRQAIYGFERDRPGQTVCYGACAKAWPPVFTKGRPRAGKGVRGALLGTVERRDGRRQVTYAGRPLYYYAHEGPGEVRCHNVNLNGGLWWVLGPDGDPRP